jgi:hypothetical protein
MYTNETYLFFWDKNLMKVFYFRCIREDHVTNVKPRLSTNIAVAVFRMTASCRTRSGPGVGSYAADWWSGSSGCYIIGDEQVYEEMRR